ncbi:MAG: hypothetical protein JWQ09_3452 [Segetibacter sp.]|nr:hypothetical protein [Segetibacter sp.]
MRRTLLLLLLVILYKVSSSQCTSVSISTQPQNKTANEGNTATFSVSVKGTSPFSYFWYKNGSFIASTTNTSSTINSYTTPTLNSANNGSTYYCLITNCSSSHQVQSSTVTVTVTTACTAVSKGTTQPQSQTVNAGSTSTFSTSVNGTPPFSYFWYKNGSFITSTTNTSSTSNSYTTPTLTTTDNSSTYYCLTSNCSSSYQVQSNTATLTVSTPCTAVSKGTSQPQSQTVNAGSTATFSASVNGTPPFSYFWYKNGSFIKNTTNTSSTSDSYTTPTLTADDNNSTYYCLTTNCSNSYQVQSNTATLTVSAACTAVSKGSTQPQSLTVKPGNVATFSVLVNGTPPFSYFWYKNGVFIKSTTGTSSNSNSYTTPTLTSADNGSTYYCLTTNCTNNNEVKSDIATVTVNSNCIAVTKGSSQPQSQTVSAGSTATFSASADGTPPFSYFWYKNGAFVKSTTNTSSSTNAYTTPILTSADNGSTYYCLVTNCSNSYQAQSNTATLNVSSSCIGASISSQSRSQTVIVGSTTTFSVTASGTPPFQYFWYKNGVQVQGAQSSSYTTPTLTTADNGNYYYCLLTNCNSQSGTSSSKAYLTVNSSAQLTYSTTQNAIKPKSKQLTVADPIQLGTGTYAYKHSDINIPSINGALSFTRFYNSLNRTVLGPLGYGWSNTYNYFIQNKQDTAWDVHFPEGYISTFIPIGSSGQSFPIFGDIVDSLEKNTNKSYSLFTKEKKQYHFDASGRLDSIIDLNNNITKFYYTGNTLDSIAAPGTRSLVLTYSGSKISTLKDPLNRIYNYTYDGSDNLVAVKDAANATTSFTYDAEHNMLTAVNPLGDIIVDNTYNGSGKVITQKDAYSKVTSIVYDFPNSGDATVTNPDNSQIVTHHDNYIRKTSERDELGFTKTFSYDANSNENVFTNENNLSETRLFDSRGNLVIDTLPGGKLTQAAYNYFNAPVQLTDGEGNQKKFYYNSINNNLDSIRYFDNSLQVFSYNTNGHVIESTDGNGNGTNYTYSAAGDLLAVKTFAGIKQYAYDAAGRKISETDENNHTTNYVYDNNDNIIKITDPLGRTIENIYDANNQLLSVKDKKGFITAYTYDKKGRKITSTNAKGGVTTYAYDARDNLISVSDPANNVVSYTYDKKGRKTSTTNALGTTEYQYDAVGNLSKVIDPTNKTTEYTYTATNKKQSEKDGLGNTSTFNYDNNDNLVSATDPLNRVTSYRYDDMNRLVSVEDAAKKTTSVTYDRNGNKKTVVDPNGHIQNYKYNAANRMIEYQDAAGNNYTYSYDSAGNNTALIKPTGTIAKVFDAGNRVVIVNNSTGDNYHFAYDNNDNVIMMSNSAGITNVAYDSLNQLKQYQDPYNKTVSFTYDAAGNKTSVIYPDTKTVSYTYDNANNLKSVTDWLNHTFSYTYDAAGRTTRLVYPNATECNYGFDNAGRLTSKISSLNNNTVISGSTFTLDAIGNRVAEQRQGPIPFGLPLLSRAYGYADDDKILSDSIWSFVNDNSGNRTSETNGIKTASYTFSVDNLLNNWVDTTGTNSSYTYDPAGHRISKVVGANSNRYVLDISSSLSQILEIADASGVAKSNYVYGLGLLESVDASNKPLYYHFDAQHNTTALTDQNAVIKDTYTYDPFGTMLSQNGIEKQPFTFLGEYGVEQETSALYYARARYYDAANGRFVSKDVHEYDLNNPQTINKYVYATNNPLSIFDYTGLYGSQDDNQNKSNQSFINYLINNSDASDVGGLSSDIADHLLKFAPANSVTSSLSGINEVLGDAYLLKDAYDISSSTVHFAADAYNNKATGSEWAHTLKTIAVTGGGIIVGGSVAVAGAPIIAVVAVGVGFYALDKGIDYLWKRNNWDKALNKLW